MEGECERRTKDKGRGYWKLLRRFDVLSADIAVANQPTPRHRPRWTDWRRGLLQKERKGSCQSKSRLHPHTIHNRLIAQLFVYSIIYASRVR